MRGEAQVKFGHSGRGGFAALKPDLPCGTGRASTGGLQGGKTARELMSATVLNVTYPLKGLIDISR